MAPLPVTSIPDFTALPMGIREDGRPYALRLFGTQVLIVGATGAGKGSVIWSLVRALAPGVASGLGAAVGVRPQGRHGTRAGERLFARFACQRLRADGRLPWTRR